MNVYPPSPPAMPKTAPSAIPATAPRFTRSSPPSRRPRMHYDKESATTARYRTPGARRNDGRRLGAIPIREGRTRRRPRSAGPQEPDGIVLLEKVGMHAQEGRIAPAGIGFRFARVPVADRHETDHVLEQRRVRRIQVIDRRYPRFERSRGELIVRRLHPEGMILKEGSPRPEHGGLAHESAGTMKVLSARVVKCQRGIPRSSSVWSRA